MTRKGIHVGLLPRDLEIQSSKFCLALGGKERDSRKSKLKICWPEDSLPFLPSLTHPSVPENLKRGLQADFLCILTQAS